MSAHVIEVLLLKSYHWEFRKADYQEFFQKRVIASVLSEALSSCPIIRNLLLQAYYYELDFLKFVIRSFIINCSAILFTK